MVRQNPSSCGAELLMLEGRACCELPLGHVGPHRASGPPHAPRRYVIVRWGGERSERLTVDRALIPIDAA